MKQGNKRDVVNHATGGLWSFRDITYDPHNSRCVRIRFAEKATNLHKKHIMDAFHAWMVAQKMIMDNGGNPIKPEQALEMITNARAGE